MAALEVEGLTPAQQGVLNALCLRADQYKCRCKVGQERLAKDTGLHRGSVWRAVRRLAELGHISVEQRPGKRNVYTVTVARDPSRDATPTPRVVQHHPARDATPPRAPRADMKESLDNPGRSGKAAPQRGDFTTPDKDALPARPDFSAVKARLAATTNATTKRG
jgi:DNA-binding transcriptional MocR family regulator